MPDHSEILAFAHELADASGAVIRPHFRQRLDIDDKGSGARILGEGVLDYDPVTAADRDAEAAIVRKIRARYPNHAVFGEEHGRVGEGPETWVIDPIDGTRSFISGFPTWGTLIAYNDGRRPVVGVMDQPVTGERFVGSEAGAFLGSRRLSVRPCSELESAVLYTTTPDMFSADELAGFAELERRVRLRRFGGDCYAYCMLALGFVDLVVEAGLKAYDIQALVPIVEHAGGVVTTWTGDCPDLGGRIVAAGDARVHEEALFSLRHVS